MKSDITIYGATGFTGVQAVHALNEACQKHGLSLAIAGRNLEKLKAVAKQLNNPVRIMVADSADRKAIDSLTRQSKLVVNLAGPFARYAPLLISSCVENYCDYVDITGEATFIYEMIKLHHPQAQKNGVRIIPFCGFDSIPSDLGSYYVLQEWRKRFADTGESCQNITALFQIRGGFNGGTIASAINLAKDSQTQVLNRNLNLLSDPDGLNPPVAPDWKSPRKIATLKAYGAPFFMAQINTRVVRRSQSLFSKEFPDMNFCYEEGLLVKESLPVTSSMISGALWGVELLSRSKMLVALAEKLAPKPGTGPSEKNMDSGFAKVTYVATGSQGSILKARFESRGDPGNKTTIKLLTQAALCLALDDERKKLPTTSGVLTPAFAFRNILIDRLRKNGVTLELA